MKNTIVLNKKDDLDLTAFKKGKVHRVHIKLSDNSLGVPWRIPVIIIKGTKPGPKLGITAAVHGDELNGLFTIFKLVDSIDPKKMSGTLILVPISNIPGYLMNQRYFSDNVDLNRIMPGNEIGKPSNIYAHFFTKKIIGKLDYLLDLHTASQGRVNSLYIRACLEDEQCKNLAYLQNPQIIVNKDNEDGTLRAWANKLNIPSITIEIGNSGEFQHQLIDESLDGIMNTMIYLKMLDGKQKNYIKDAIICESSYWIYSKHGGIINVLPKLTDLVKKGEVIARVYNVFGDVKEEIKADTSGIVIGKNIKPNGDTGTRVLHLGVVSSD